MTRGTNTSIPNKSDGRGPGPGRGSWEGLFKTVSRMFRVATPTSKERKIPSRGKGERASSCQLETGKGMMDTARGAVVRRYLSS